MSVSFIDEALSFVTPGGGNKTTSTTDVTEETKTVELPYLQTLMLLSGEVGMDSLQTEAQRWDSIRDDPNKVGELQFGWSPGIGAKINFAQILSGGFAGRDVSWKTTVDAGGWLVKKQSTVTKWDKARYAVGIKEIGVWTYYYSERSGFISVPFRTPKPIRSVSLYADQVVPKAFNTGVVKRWIRYWLSFNDNDTWFEIAPADEGAVNLIDGLRVPQIVHVNSGIPQSERDARDGYADFDGEVSMVRLKCIMERPSQYTDMTPVLKSYRLRMTVRSPL